jgi:CRISPR-associated protein Cas2
MLEMAPGVYSAPRISPNVRERLWRVLSEWSEAEDKASIVMLWQDYQVTEGQAVQVLGEPLVELIEIDGLILTRR